MKLSSKLELMGNRLGFECPGCGMMHAIPVSVSINLPDGTVVPPTTEPTERPVWNWNGDVNRPTFSPSLNTTWDHLSQAARARHLAFYAQHGRYPTREEEPYDVHEVCHLLVNDGMIQFLGDCTHALANQTVPIPDLK